MISSPETAILRIKKIDAATPAWPGPIPVVDLAEFAGCLVLREDPVEYQKRMRAEWDRDTG